MIGPGDSYIGMWRMVNRYRYRLDILDQEMRADTLTVVLGMAGIHVGWPQAESVHTMPAAQALLAVFAVVVSRHKRRLWRLGKCRKCLRHSGCDHRSRIPRLERWISGRPRRSDHDLNRSKATLFSDPFPPS
jgi:hypothetical protein